MLIIIIIIIIIEWIYQFKCLVLFVFLLWLQNAVPEYDWWGAAR